MSSKNKNKDVWDEIEDEEPFFSFRETNDIKIKFLSDDFVKDKTEFEGNEVAQFNFEGLDLKDNEVKILSVTSKRLMRQLKQMKPLKDRKFTITRIGSKFHTKYIIEEIKK